MNCLGIIRKPSKWWKFWDLKAYYSYSYMNPNTLEQHFIRIRVDVMDRFDWQQKDKYLSIAQEVSFWYTGGYGRQYDQ